MPILTVGTGQEFATIAAAIAASQDGDVIQVQAGTYTDDFAIINTKITIEGVGGMVHLVAQSEPGNGKGIFVINTDVTLNNLEFSGAKVGDGNGAGIRYQGGNLVINNCFFHDNQDGLLGTPHTPGTGSITITNSEFKHNGSGDGFTHNLYVGQVATLDITGSFFHDAVVGHEIKSLASTTIIENSTIVDGNGTASYSIDLPDGGNATISNNLIEQGPNSQNPAIISVGESGNIYAGSNVSVTNNTILNDLPNNKNVRVFYNHHGVPISFTDNSVFGVTEANIALNPPITEHGTTFLTVEPSFACFAKGTLIHTPAGDMPIEALRSGMQVITLVAGEEVPQAITWLGHRRISLAGHPRPETAAPIRIERDAFADGMPLRDLLVSPDHAIFVDGMLICARQLINGMTIRQEKGWTSVDYFHVELDEHAILLAEGLPTESYLDTGNRGFFCNSGEPLVLHPDLANKSDYPTREAASCAQFVWDETSVQPVWQRLFDRAAAIGRPGLQRVTTTEADLRLLVDRRTVRPVFSGGNLFIFVLPTGAPEVRLLSRAQAPTEARPWLGDQRRLGVRVKRIVLRGADDLREVPVDHPDLTRGWWSVERDGQIMSRWTNGEAVLPLPAMCGNVVLEILLAGSMNYVVDAVPAGGAGRRDAA